MLMKHQIKCFELFRVGRSKKWGEGGPIVFLDRAGVNLYRMILINCEHIDTFIRASKYTLTAMGRVMNIEKIGVRNHQIRPRINDGLFKNHNALQI